MPQPKSRTASIKALRDLLESEAGSTEKADAAFAQIMEAVSDYDAEHVLVTDKSGEIVGKSEPRATEIRRDLVRIERALNSTQAQIGELPFHSRRLLAKATGLSFGELDRALVPLIDGARQAVLKAAGLPNKPADHAREFLARDVARTMWDTLGKKPTATRPGTSRSHSRGGAFYGRLLLTTLKIVGIKQVSIGPLIDEGRRLHKCKSP